MTDQELSIEGYRLCQFGGECDGCRKDAPRGEYFWRRTSHEYIEGYYYCRTCAAQDHIDRMRLYDSYAVQEPTP